MLKKNKELCDDQYFERNPNASQSKLEKKKLYDEKKQTFDRMTDVSTPEQLYEYYKTAPMPDLTKRDIVKDLHRCDIGNIDWN